ncbi:MAG TPA: heat-inducible transcriptional repressor HrcA, partial [Microlunatus sp.]
MLDDRKLDVLRAIVTDYVSSQEPVGSKALVDRHDLGVSPATVRNDMAVLEEEGYITQPHTSAGRIPTDKGYRLFVDRLGSVKPLSAAERRAIQTFLSGAMDLDDVLSRTVRLLAQVTQQVAIVQYPTLSHATVRHVEVVSLSTQRLMLVMISSTGRVEQRLVEVAEVDEEELALLRTLLNEAVVGQTTGEAVRTLSGVLADAELADGSVSPTARAVASSATARLSVATLLEMLGSDRSSR